MLLPGCDSSDRLHRECFLQSISLANCHYAEDHVKRLSIRLYEGRSKSGMRERHPSHYYITSRRNVGGKNTLFIHLWLIINTNSLIKKSLSPGESNPALSRDRGRCCRYTREDMTIEPIAHFLVAI